MANTRKKYLLIVGAAVAALIVVRLSLPFFITRYINNAFSDMRDYRGSVSDVDLHLYRGAYVVHDLSIVKSHGNADIPFIHVPDTEFNVDWNAALHGVFAGRIIFIHPEINLIHDASGRAQLGEGVGWMAYLNRVASPDLNHLEVKDGKLNFYDFTKKPPIELHMYKINLTAIHLNDTRRYDAELPSAVHATAASMGGGDVMLDMKMDASKKIPDLDFNTKFEGISLTALNKVFEAYMKVNFKQGNLSIYSEFAVDRGRMSGYVKPVMRDIKIVRLGRDNTDPLKFIWRSVVRPLRKLFENQGKDQVITKVIPLKGDLGNAGGGFWAGIWNIYKDALINGFANDKEHHGEIGGAGK